MFCKNVSGLGILTVSLNKCILCFHNLKSDIDFLVKCLRITSAKCIHK